jgi:hypothetical protein
MTVRLSTPGQHSFLKTLVQERTMSEALEARVTICRNLAVRDLLTFAAASDLINDLKAAPYKENQGRRSTPARRSGRRAWLLRARSSSNRSTPGGG